MTAAAFALAISPFAAANAHPIANPAGAGAAVLVSSTENVIAQYLGTTADYTSLLYLVRPGDTDLYLFNNQADPTGKQVNLGSFALGTELVFKLVVLDTGNTFFSGLASRNPDSHAHAAVESNFGAPGTTLVSFEDLYNGSFDYNDLSFSFTGTMAGGVPEPATWALMIIGFGGVSFAMRRRRIAALA
jgi:hypothetical protein